MAGYAVLHEFWLFAVLSAISGLGVGLNAPSTKAALAALASDDDHQTTVFSFRGIAANVGIAAAGGLSYFVLGGSFSVIFWTAAGLFAVLGLLSRFGLPRSVGGSSGTPVRLSDYRRILADRKYVGFSLLSLLIWALYTQFSLSLPLKANAVLSNPNAVRLVWTINSLTVILLQAPVSKIILRRIHPLAALSAGVLLIGIGLGAVYWAASFPLLIVCGVVFIFGEMLLMPTIDATVSKFAQAQTFGVFFGISNFVAGLGEGTGKYLGGQLFRAGTERAFPWTALFISALALSLLLWGLQFRPGIRKRHLGRTYETRAGSLTDWLLGKRRAK